MKVQCMFCKIEFRTYPSLIKKGSGKYCSNKCRGADKKGIFPIQLSSFVKKGECLNSGKTHFKKGVSSWNKGVSPSKETRIKIGLTGLGRRAWNKGLHPTYLQKENHPQWKGGITKLMQAERAKFRKTIQKQVFERDNYTCKLCGDREKDMTVDHIQPWAEYVELRFCIDNCRTLCQSCHYTVTYGKPMPPSVRAWGHNLKGGIEKYA